MKGHRVITDPNAASADPDLPAFIARPAGAPAYHGFAVIPETYVEGWCLGAITEFADADGCTDGDAFVVAPDGSRAGLVWNVGADHLTEILPPDPGRWGVYAISFPVPIRSVEDLVLAFHSILPQLKARHALVQMPSNTSLERP
jgi:hypothetical protein